MVTKKILHKTSMFMEEISYFKLLQLTGALLQEGEKPFFLLLLLVEFNRF